MLLLDTTVLPCMACWFTVAHAVLRVSTHGTVPDNLVMNECVRRIVTTTVVM